MYSILKLLATTVSIYSILCFARILLTWFPGAVYSKPGMFLAKVCDPYLNYFRRLSFLRISGFDFTPAVAICILIAVSSLLGNMALARAITVGLILAHLISLLWSVVSSVLSIVIILLIVRIVVLFMNKGYTSYSSIWEQLDRSITPLVYKLTGLLSKGTMPYKNALIMALIMVMLIQFGGKSLIGFLCQMLASLPF